MEKSCYTCSINAEMCVKVDCFINNYKYWRPSEMKPKGYNYIPIKKILNDSSDSRSDSKTIET